MRPRLSDSADGNGIRTEGIWRWEFPLEEWGPCGGNWGPEPALRGGGGGGGGQQGNGVGVGGPLEHVFKRTDFHDFTQIHDRDSVADILAGSQIMGDEQIGQIKFLFEPDHEFEQHGPDRDVGHGDGLVRHHEIGIGDQGPGDDHPLTLAAGKLVRIFFRQERGRRKADLFHDVQGPVPDLAIGQFSVNPERMADGFGDAHARAQRGVGVLEDDLKFFAHGPHLLMGVGRKWTGPCKAPPRMWVRAGAGAADRWWSCRSRSPRPRPEPRPCARQTKPRPRPGPPFFPFQKGRT